MCSVTCNRRSMIRGVLTVGFLVVLQPITAQVILNNKQDKYAVDQVFYYRTTDRDLDITEVQERDFDPLDIGQNPSLGFDRAVHWFRFDVLNRSQTTNWLLEIGYSPLDHIEFYFPDSRGNWSLQYSGDLYPVSTRPTQHRNFVFPFSLRNEMTHSVIVKVMSTSSIQVPFTVWSTAGLNGESYDDQFWHGLFYGMMIIMVLYNLFTYFVIGDRSTLYYVLTLLAATTVIAFLQGYMFFYLYPEYPEWNQFFHAFSPPFFIVASTLLTRSFLDLQKFSFLLDRTLLAIAIVTLGLGIITIGLGDYVTYTPLHVLGVLDFCIILISALYCFYRNYQPARYFLIAWGLLMIVGVFLSLHNLGLIESNWLANNGLYMVGVFQSLLLSLALGDRLNIMQHEQSVTREIQLRLESEAKEKLEREVMLRTEEIRSKHRELENSNTVKDKLFSIVSHDLKGPLNSLRGILEGVRLGALSQEDHAMLMKRIGEQLHLTSDFLDNLLQWSRTQLQGENFVPKLERFSMRDLLGSCTRLLVDDFRQKNIALKMNVQGDYHVIADMNMIDTVLRNLVSNALKFTMPGGRVELIVAKLENMVRVDVRDNGIGIPTDHLDTLFTLQGITTAGTREEKGTGIGLVVCREFVERNGGTIRAFSTAGQGSTFTFTVPAG